MQWLTHQMLEVDNGREAPAVVVAGADEISCEYLERLSDVCERRRIPLTLLFRHLRESSLQLIGGGAVAFMRLGNHEEAARAADFVGRHHTFVLSGLTRTSGASETRGSSTTRGQSVSESENLSKIYGRRVIVPDVSTGRSASATFNVSDTESTMTSETWADAATMQRAYDYRVEPTTLQHLPDHAPLVVEAISPIERRMQITPADCNPAIIALPKVTTDPLPNPGFTAPQGGGPTPTL